MAKRTKPCSRILGAAGAPEAPPGPRRRGLQFVENRGIAVVGRDRQRPGEAAADEDRVDEAVAEVDVGEQAPVDVAALSAEDELHRPAFEQVMGECGWGAAGSTGPGFRA